MNNKKYGIEGFDAPELNYLILKESLLFCIVFKVGVLAVIK